MLLFHEIVCFVLRFTILPLFARITRSSSTVTIVNYHDPQPDVFRKHLQYLTRTFSLISMEDMLGALTNGSWRTLPTHPLVICLDDGHKGNAALTGLLDQFKVPAVLYVTGGLVDTRRHFWFRIITRHSPHGHELRRMPDHERRMAMERDFAHTDEREYEDRHALTSQEIRQLQQAGCTVASHTMWHPILTLCDDETVRYEIGESKRAVSAVMGMPVRHFAYPAGEWNESVQRSVQENGYQTARTASPGRVTHDTDPFALPTYGISDNAGVSKCAVQASGLWDAIRSRAKRSMT